MYQPENEDAEVLIIEAQTITWVGARTRDMLINQCGEDPDKITPDWLAALVETQWRDGQFL